jgi:hypothetical protein
MFQIAGPGGFRFQHGPVWKIQAMAGVWDDFTSVPVSENISPGKAVRLHCKRRFTVYSGKRLDVVGGIALKFHAGGFPLRDTVFRRWFETTTGIMKLLTMLFLVRLHETQSLGSSESC